MSFELEWFGKVNAWALANAASDGNKTCQRPLALIKFWK
jgi:hypothetical protein